MKKRPLIIGIVVLLVTVGLSGCNQQNQNVDGNTSNNNLQENQPPTASLTADTIQGYSPLTVSFHGSGSDSDGTIISYHWDFGDGTTSNEQNPSHSYSSSGIFSVTLKITDNDGIIGKDTIYITVFGGLYTNTEYGYTFHPPPGWTTALQKFETDSATFTGPTYGTWLHITIPVSMSGLKGPDSGQEFYDKTFGGDDNYSFISAYEREIGGEDSYATIFLNVDSGDKEQYIFVPHNEEYFLIIFYAKPGAFDKNLELFNASIDTFTFTS